jgi:hypothetical protein
MGGVSGTLSSVGGACGRGLHFGKLTGARKVPHGIPVFRADSVVLAISAEKDGRFRPRKTGICGWSTPGSDAAKVALPGEVLKLR